MTRALELKIPPPVLAVAIAVAMGAWLWRNDIGPNLSWLRLLTVAVFFGMGLASIAFAIQNLRHSKTTVSPMNPAKTARLVTEGIYGTSRNPIYLGLLILLGSFARAFDTGWVYLGPLMFFLLIDRLQIRPEERILAEKFGDEYRNYMSKVRRWI